MDNSLKVFHLWRDPALKPCVRYAKSRSHPFENKNVELKDRIAVGIVDSPEY